MQHREMSNSALARACGVSSAAVGQWLNNDTKAPKAENIFKIAAATGVSAKWLTTGKGRMVEGSEETPGTYETQSNVERAPVMREEVPMLSWVQAGSWTEVFQDGMDPELTEWLPRPPGCSSSTFAVRVVGESMAPRYPQGQIIFVDPEADARSGDDVVAVLTGANEATFKRLVQEPGGQRMLKAINPAWPEPYLAIDDDCQVIGVVMADMHIRIR